MRESRSDNDADARAFILAHTRLAAPPIVPEIELHLAEECLPLWEASEAAKAQANVAPPFWAFAWAGGQALARYILDNPDAVRGKTVLDLGAGSGLGAIAAMRSGAATALAADIDPFACAAMTLNAAANGVAIDVTSDDLLASPLMPFDIILVGDLFYERGLAECVLERVSAAAQAGAAVLTGDPNRTYFPADRFTRIATYDVPVSRDLEDADVKTTGVYRLAELCRG